MIRRCSGVALTCWTLAGCGVLDRGFLSPAGPIARATRDEFLLVCFIMLFVVGPVLILVPLIAWHYRLSNTHAAFRPQWGFNWSLEGLIWIPPSIIVVVLAVFLWRDTHRLDPYKPLPGTPIEIEAVALDWKWMFIYPDQGVATVNHLVVPAGQAVHLRLTSATVMQSFLIPKLAGQIYAMGGMQTQLDLRADAPGRFRGENTQFNGLHFQDQKFAVDALSHDAFERWLGEAHAQPNRLDTAAYQMLSHRSVQPKPLLFGAVEPDLFKRILNQSLPSGHTTELRKLGPPTSAMPMEKTPHDPR